MKTIQSKSFWLVAIIAVGLTALLIGCKGIDLGDYVSVDTPAAIQQSHGLPASMTLNEAEIAYDTWFSETAINGTAWKGNVERSRDTVQLFNSLALNGIQELVGSEWAAAIPGLTLLAGLFIRRPGDTSEADAAEREKASYNKGQRATVEVLEQRARTSAKSDADAQTIIDVLKKLEQAT